MSPKWVPLDARGESWQFLSGRGRKLGLITLMAEYGAEPHWYAVRQCCGIARIHYSLGSAASYVLGTLYCEPCAQIQIRRQLDRFTS